MAAYALRVGTPRVLFDDREIACSDVVRDGQRFLVAENPKAGVSTHLDVTLDWFAEVKRKVAETQRP